MFIFFIGSWFICEYILQTWNRNVQEELIIGYFQRFYFFRMNFTRFNTMLLDFSDIWSKLYNVSTLHLFLQVFVNLLRQHVNSFRKAKAFAFLISLYSIHSFRWESFQWLRNLSEYYIDWCLLLKSSSFTLKTLKTCLLYQANWDDIS